MVDHQPLRPLLPPQRKMASYLAEYLGTALIPIFFIGMIVSLKYTFAGGGSWECSGDGCLEQFDRLKGWTFPIPLFVMDFVCTFGFVGAILLRIWGRSGRPPTFEPKKRMARPALSGVGKNLMWVGVLELALAGGFLFARQWLVAGILGSVGLVLVLSAYGVAAKASRSDRILETGVPAMAEITEVVRTGSTLNDNPLMKLTLTIHQDGVPLFPVVHKEFVPLGYLHRLQVGAQLPVRVDPLDSNSLVIEWDRPLAETAY